MAHSTRSRPVGSWLAGAVIALVVPVAVRAQPQDAPAKNPFQVTPQVIQEGTAAFRANCAYCHGMDAKGMRGPDLTGVFGGGATEEGLYRTVRRGIPGTEMPAAGVFLPEPDTWKVLMYLRTLSVSPPNEPPPGNAENGERIFRAQCRSCHRVEGQGSALGPDLSRIGVGRTRAALTRKIRGSVEEIRPGYEPVAVTLDDGRTVRGTRKNEDLFSIQIMDSSERLQGIVKSATRGVAREQRSTMPAYGVDRLNQADLDDLLRYLGTLRAPAPSTLQ